VRTLCHARRPTHAPARLLIHSLHLLVCAGVGRRNRGRQNHLHRQIRQGQITEVFSLPVWTAYCTVFMRSQACEFIRTDRDAASRIRVWFRICCGAALRQLSRRRAHAHHTCPSHPHLRTSPRAHERTRAHTHTRTHTHTYTYAHAHTQTRAHTWQFWRQFSQQTCSGRAGQVEGDHEIENARVKIQNDPIPALNVRAKHDFPSMESKCLGWTHNS